MKIIRHNTLDDLLAALYEISVEELQSSEMGGCDLNGDEYAFPYDEICSHIKVERCYGYADHKNQEIHLWIDAEDPPEFAGLLALLSHEIAHNTGTQCVDDMDEEKRAEEMSDVAVAAYELCREVLNP